MSTPTETRHRHTTPTATTAITRAVAGLRDPLRRTTSVLSWITRAAWVVLAIGVVSWIAGAQLGWLELVVLGVGMLAVLVASAFFAIGRHPYAITLRLREGRVVVGDRAMGGIDVRNTGSVPVLPARLELPVGPVTARFALPALSPGGEHDELFAIPTDRRGVLVVGPVRSVRGDPFGLIRRAVQWTDPARLGLRRLPARPGGPGLPGDHERGPVLPRPARVRPGR